MSPNGDVTRWCYNCGVEIIWVPIRSWGRYYCCKTCLRGDPCECAPPKGEEEGPMEERRRAVKREW